MYVCFCSKKRFRASRRLNLEVRSVWEFNLDESQKVPPHLDVRQCIRTSHEWFLQEVIYTTERISSFFALIVWIKCPEICGQSCRESGELPFPMKRHFQGYVAPVP